MAYFILTDQFELTSQSHRLPYVDECESGHCRPDTGERYLTCLRDGDVQNFVQI